MSSAAGASWLTIRGCLVLLEKLLESQLDCLLLDICFAVVVVRDQLPIRDRLVDVGVQRHVKFPTLRDFL